MSASSSFSCSVCSQSFASRNQLFAHLKTDGHTTAGHQPDPQVALARQQAEQLTQANFQAFKSYYALQSVCSTDLWSTSLEALKLPLPLVVRMQNSSPVRARAA